MSAKTTGASAKVYSVVLDSSAARWFGLPVWTRNLTLRAARELHGQMIAKVGEKNVRITRRIAKAKS